MKTSIFMKSLRDIIGEEPTPAAVASADTAAKLKDAVRTALFVEAFRDVVGREPTPTYVEAALDNPEIVDEIDHAMLAIEDRRKRGGDGI